MVCELEKVPLTRKQEAELEVAELKMLRFLMRATGKDKVKNEYIYEDRHMWAE